MPVLSLSSSQQEEIFCVIKGVFLDLKCFDQIALSIKMLICDATKMEIDPLFLLNLEDRYLSNQPHLQNLLLQYQQSNSLSKVQKTMTQQLKIILTTSVVYLYSFHSFVKNSLYLSVDELLQHYPSFKEEVAKQYPKKEDQWQEMQYLLYFRNFMVIALMLIPAKGNKTFLLKVVERLEGSGKEYIMGSGQKPAVTRRLDIFHQESRVPIARKNGKRLREKQYQLLLKNELFLTAKEERKENSPQMQDTLLASSPRKRSISPEISSQTQNHQQQCQFTAYSSRSTSIAVSQNDFAQYALESRVSSFETSWEMAEETRDILLNEEYSGSFSEEIHHFLMDEDE